MEYTAVQGSGSFVLFGVAEDPNGSIERQSVDVPVDVWKKGAVPVVIAV